MKSASIGIPAASPSKRIEADARAGFTLIEALVALSVLLAFAAALGPLMVQSHRILVNGRGQVRAELLLRSLLATPIDRMHPDLGLREGESGGLRWRLAIEPAASDPRLDDDAPRISSKKPGHPDWSLLRLTASVFWGAGQTVMAETYRLGRLD